MLTELLEKITNGLHLTEREAQELIGYLGSGAADTEQIAAFLLAIKEKGETVAEMTGFARGMRESALKINTGGIHTIVDSCGTGGDGSNTFNISTAAAIMAAAGGIVVAKHSNYSITSKCGSSNVLEALGIPLLQTAEGVESSLKEHSIAFIHAPYFHKSTYYVNQVRKQLGVRTIFNYLGPLTNPVFPTGQIVGVPNPEMLPKMISVLKNLGCRRAMAVCGLDPVVDELSICGRTLVYELYEGNISSYQVKPEMFGLKTASITDVEGGDPDFNAGIIRDIFAGKEKGAKRDVVLLNTAAVLWAGEKVSSLKEGIGVALELIESGLALEKLERIVQNCAQ